MAVRPFDGAALLAEQEALLSSSSAADINYLHFLRIRLSAQQRRTAQRNQQEAGGGRGGSGDAVSDTRGRSASIELEVPMSAVGGGRRPERPRLSVDETPALAHQRRAANHPYYVEAAAAEEDVDQKQQPQQPQPLPLQQQQHRPPAASASASAAAVNPHDERPAVAGGGGGGGGGWTEEYPPDYVPPHDATPAAVAAAPPGAEAAATDDERMDCPYCGRRFAADRIDKHVEICFRSAQREAQRRARGDVARQQRLAAIYGSAAPPPELANARPATAAAAPTGTAPSNRKAGGGADGGGGAEGRKEPKWRAQSAQLRRAMGADGGGGQAAAAAEPVDDRVPCPGCGRRFAPESAPRHINFCTNRKK